MRAEFVQTEWFRGFVGALASAGVTDVVVSPGSRSTPLVAAAVGEPRLHVLTVLDERSASFVALGLGRASGRPTVLVRTSGSAGGHDLPAIIEADEACVPLITVTADRPPELRRSGASQTIDQHGLFGARVRSFTDLGPPSLEGLRSVFRRAAEVVADARGPRPGPVHVNAPARKPLEPVSAESPEERALSVQVDARVRDPLRVVAARESFGPAALADVRDVLASARCGAVIAGPRRGPLPGPGLMRFLEASGFALVAEASSGLARIRHVEAHDWIDAPERLDVVIGVGAQPTSKALQGLRARAERLVVVDPWSIIDPDHAAVAAFLGPVDPWFEAAARGLEPRSASHRDGWRAAGARARAVIREALRQEELSEGAAVADVVGRLNANCALVLGNSLPIRMVDRYADAPPGHVFTQRGASGIDGLIAGAVGISLEQPGPTVLLLGDVSFAHDVSSLASARLVSEPLAIVVIDNDGGRIFDELPIARVAPELMPHFHTSPQLDVQAAARAYGVRTVRVERREELCAIDEALRVSGPTVVHVCVRPSDLASRVARSVEALDGPG